MHARPPRFRPAWLLLALDLLHARPALSDWPSSPLVNVPICTAANQQNGSTVVADDAGGAIIAWTDFRGGAAGDIYAQRVRLGGLVDARWPANGRALCDTAGTQTAVAIVRDMSGGAIVAWQDARSSGTFDIYAQHVLASGAVDPAWPSQGRALCTEASSQITPVAIADGLGGAIVAWQDLRGGVGSDDVYAQHVWASGEVDSRWPANGRAVCTAAGSQQRLKLIPGAQGGAIVVWQDSRGGVGSDDIYAQRVTADGVLDAAWPADGLVVCGAALVQQSPAVAEESAGGAIVTWSDFRAGTGESDVYAQHVLGSGTVDPAWPTECRAVCLATDFQQNLAIVTDDAGGAIVGWADFRSGVASDIYAQRVLANGETDSAWPLDGRALCAAPGGQTSTAIATDGAGGAIVTWADFRDSETAYDIFAQHVRANGTLDPLWPTDGRAVCTIVGVQSVPKPVPDGANGVIVAWTDQRAGSQGGDIYAQRVQSDGQLDGGVLVVPHEPRPGIALNSVHPNPVHGGVLTVDCTLGSDAGAALAVVDVAGRLVAVRELPARGSGRQTATVELGSQLAPGLYLVTLRQGGAIRSERLVVLE